MIFLMPKNFIFSVFSLLLGIASNVSACSCSYSGPIPRPLSIVQGAKISVYVKAEREIPGKAGESPKIQFKILESFRGDLKDRFSVNNGPGEDGCQTVFHPGKKYILILDSKDTDWISHCFGSWQVSHLSSEQLRAFKSPTAEDWRQDTESSKLYMAGNAARQKGDPAEAQRDWEQAAHLGNIFAQSALEKLHDGPSPPTP